jgi:hypothetical protein
MNPIISISIDFVSMTSLNCNDLLHDDGQPIGKKISITNNNVQRLGSKLVGCGLALSSKLP